MPTTCFCRSEVRATSGKGFIRLMAEHEWLHLYYNYHAPVHIFRCGGIYGPRRSAIEAVRQAGLPSPSQRRRAQQQYTSRVHVYDICQTIEASTRHPNPGTLVGCKRRPGRQPGSLSWVCLQEVWRPDAACGACVMHWAFRKLLLLITGMLGVCSAYPDIDIWFQIWCFGNT